jgi:hypothetical protein
MKLKKILPNLDGLAEAIAAFYTKRDDGKFHLSLEDDDGEELRRAKEHEKGLRQIAERERDDARTALTTTQTELDTLKANAPKDVQTLRETLTSEYEGKINKLKTDHSKELEGLTGTIKQIFVHDVASGIAKDIAIDEGAAELLTDAIARRLTVEMVDGKPLTRVVSADGKPSAMTPDELKKEYFTNERFAGIMRASDASGGGASGGGRGAGGPKKLSEMGDAERTKMSKEDPVGFKKLMEDARKGA